MSTAGMPLHALLDGGQRVQGGGDFHLFGHNQGSHRRHEWCAALRRRSRSDAARIPSMLLVWRSVGSALHGVLGIHIEDLPYGGLYGRWAGMACGSFVDMVR